MTTTITGTPETPHVDIRKDVVVSVIYERRAPTQGTVVVDGESAGFMTLSTASFAEDWNSPADSVYDDDVDD